jgi:hypothetical protein
MSHVLAYHDLLGFLDCLLHVETLLLSSVSREDGELGGLDAVLEGQPGMHSKALVRLAIHAKQQILGVHFSPNLVQLGSRPPNNKAAEQFVCLLVGLCYCKFALGLKGFLTSLCWPQSTHEDFTKIICI